MGKIRTSTAARRAGVCEETIRRAIRRGRIPATETPGGHYRIEERDLEKTMSKTAKPDR